MLGNFGKMHCLQCKKVKEEGQNRTNKMHSHMAQQPRLIALACTRTTLLQIVPQPKLLLSDDTGHSPPATGGSGITFEEGSSSHFLHGGLC